MGNVTERTTAGADGTQNHKCRGTVIETFSKVRARGLFTDRVKTIFCGIAALIPRIREESAGSLISSIPVFLTAPRAL